MFSLATGGQATSADAVAETLCGRLRVEARVFRCADGTLFQWRGVTGFRLVHQVASGDEAGARRYLEWAAESGFTVVRVLSTATVLFDLPPDVGRAALPRTIALAAEHGMYVEVVAVNDTAEIDYDWRAHARDVAERCAAASSCLFEFANEPGHGVHVDALHDMAAVDRFAAEAVAGLPLVWTAGPSWASDVEPTPTGSYVVRHLERAGTPWAMAARLGEFARLSAALGRPVVSNEPIGFDEVDGSVTGRQRTVDCDAALAFGVLGRLLEIGTTFHLQAGLQNDAPGPIQRRCAADFVAGTRLLPDDVRVRWVDPGSPESPVEQPPPGRVAAVYSGWVDDSGLTVAVGRIESPGVVWRAGFRPVEVLVDRPRLGVWRVVRTRERPVVAEARGSRTHPSRR